MRKCKCGVIIPDDWKGKECFYCWLGYTKHDDTVQETLV